MKIISKFKDYYDSVSAQYLDREIIYLRETKTFTIDLKLKPHLNYFSFQAKGTHDNWTLSLHLIGFCGEIFPLIIAASEATDERCYLYSLSDLRRFADAKNILIPEEKRHSRTRTHFYGYSPTIMGFGMFFDSQDGFSDLRRIFLEYNCPTFIIKVSASRKYSLTINHPLRDLEFARLKNPYIAHQEIYQFASSSMQAPVKPMVQISDKIKAEKHGFDKWSFRKMPSK